MSEAEIEVLKARIKEAIAQSEEPRLLYAGCRELEAVLNKDGLYALEEGLIPDLDVYLSAIMGFAYDVRRIEKWSDERRALFSKYYKRDFNGDFFTRFPAYVFVKPYMTRESTPRFCQLIKIHEQIRIDLIHLYELCFGSVE